MESHTIRHGQSETGIISHQGNEYAAGGSSVRGKDVTGYTHTDKWGRLSLRRWNGKFWFRARATVVREYRSSAWNDVYAVVFLLPHGRAIAGYALGLDGMLFRGELCDASEAEDTARSLSEFWMERDAEDEAADENMEDDADFDA